MQSAADQERITGELEQKVAEQQLLIESLQARGSNSTAVVPAEVTQLVESLRQSTAQSQAELQRLQGELAAQAAAHAATVAELTSQRRECAALQSEIEQLRADNDTLVAEVCFFSLCLLKSASQLCLSMFIWLCIVGQGGRAALIGLP